MKLVFCVHGHFYWLSVQLSTDNTGKFIGLQLLKVKSLIIRESRPNGAYRVLAGK